MDDYMKWSEFQDLVLSQLPLDANRIGLEEFLPQQIRNAVLDLQHYIPRYRKNHETIYYCTDFVIEGKAGVGTLPPSCSVVDAWVVGHEHDMYDHDFYHQHLDPGYGVDRDEDGRSGRERNQHRLSCRNWPWEHRYDLVHGRIQHFDGRPLFSIGPDNETFYLYPFIRPNEKFSLHWNGFKLTSNNDELVPYDEQAAEAVAAFATAKTALYVEHDIARHQSFMQSYALIRKNLFTQPRSNK
jgi:hypothetical protein